jgi:hypothetical protein
MELFCHHLGTGSLLHGFSSLGNLIFSFSPCV